jgi:hypothetical protein
MTSAGTSYYAQSNRPSTPYNRLETRITNANITTTDAKPEVWSPHVTREASALSDSNGSALCCPLPGHEKKTFKRKGDWKAHMDEFHKPSLTAWKCQLCQQKGCERQFETERLFRQHHAMDHRCRRNCTHADESKVTAPPRLAFACGFEGCAGLLTNWENWLGHVLGHFQSGSNVPLWKYTVEFRNLLRRPEISLLWDLHVEQQLRASQGYQQVFLWEPRTSSHLKELLEVSNLHSPREELFKHIFCAAISTSPRVPRREHQQEPVHSNTIDMPLTSLDAVNDYSVPESNAVQLLTMSNLARDNSFEAPAFNISCNTNQYPPQFQFTNQIPFNPMANSAPSLALDYSQIHYDPLWNDDEAMDIHTPSTNLVQTGIENQAVPERVPDFWYPNVPTNVPDDPLAAYGLPPNATSFQDEPPTKADQQHARTKSSSKPSLGKKISGYFSSGRKSSHSHCDSDSSDQRMGGMPAY